MLTGLDTVSPSDGVMKNTLAPSGDAVLGIAMGASACCSPQALNTRLASTTNTGVAVLFISWLLRPHVNA
jgi:hypothetical protein